MSIPFPTIELRSPEHVFWCLQKYVGQLRYLVHLLDSQYLLPLLVSDANFPSIVDSRLDAKPVYLADVVLTARVSLEHHETTRSKGHNNACAGRGTLRQLDSGRGAEPTAEDQSFVAELCMGKRSYHCINACSFMLECIWDGRDRCGFQIPDHIIATHEIDIFASRGVRVEFEV